MVINMDAKIFDRLFMSGSSNDSAFPYWIYHVEHVGMDDQHFLKVYLFNRLFDKSALDVVTFDYAGKEYRALTFSRISEYDDPNIVGCIVEVPDYDPTVNIKIVGEVVDRKTVEPAGDEVRYVKSTFPKEDDYYRKKLSQYEQRVVFPQIRDKYWQCSCGRIHSAGEEKCFCGRTKDDISTIINFNVTESKINDFLAVPFTYDVTKSFEENIEKNKQRFAQSGIDASVLDGRFDVETERAKYDELCAQKQAADAKKKKRTKITLITIASIILLAAAGYVGKTYAYPAILYSQAGRAFTNAEYDKSIETFEKLGEYKDSVEKIKEVKLAKANALLDQNEYERGIEILEELKTIKYIETETVNAARARKAQYLFDNGNYRDSSAELSGIKQKNEEWKNLWSEATYQYALQLENDHEYEKAIDQYYEIRGYKDSLSHRDNICYAYSAELFDSGDYILAKDYLQKIGNVDRSSDVYKETMYQAGLQYLKKNNYSGAIGSLNLVKGYKDANAQINEAKYQYVVHHKSRTDSSTHTYLKDLMTVGYRDSANIYNSLYQWKVTNIYFNSSSSGKTSMSSISRYNPVYCHFTVSGGPPGGAIYIYCKDVYPDGSSTGASKTSYAYRSGDSGWFGWSDSIYTNPAYGRTGNLTMYFYDTSWNLLGSGSVYIK